MVFYRKAASLQRAREAPVDGEQSQTYAAGFWREVLGTLRIGPFLCRTTHICCSYFQPLVHQKPAAGSNSSVKIMLEKIRIFKRFWGTWFNLAAELCTQQNTAITRTSRSGIRHWPIRDAWCQCQSLMSVWCRPMKCKFCCARMWTLNVGHKPRGMAWNLICLWILAQRCRF